jgi:hypothetical protein
MPPAGLASGGLKPQAPAGTGTVNPSSARPPDAHNLRRATKSTVGIVIIFVGLLIMIGFAAGDLSQPRGRRPDAVAAILLPAPVRWRVTDREMSAAMQRRLAQVREQDPEADYSSIAGDFEPLLQQLIDQKAMQAFAARHGFVISKRLVDAEIANLPGVRGLAGQVTSDSYQQFLARQRMTDREVREAISASLLQRLLLTPAASNARVPIGIATHYASMLLEERQGEVALVPVEAFAAGLDPTDAQIQQFYGANQSRYMVPEQRVLRLARIGPQQVANVTATDQEIQAFTTQTRTSMAPGSSGRSARPSFPASRSRRRSPSAPAPASRWRRRQSPPAWAPRTSPSGNRVGSSSPTLRAKRSHRRPSAPSPVRHRRPRPVAARLARGADRIGANRGRQVARPGPRRDCGGSPPRSGQTRSPTSSTRFRTRSTAAPISTRRHGPRTCRLRPLR